MNEVSSTPHWRARAAMLSCLCLATWVGYLGLAAGLHLRVPPTYSTFFELQADGFSRRELSLPILPAPELLAAPNPFDPSLLPFWKWDAALYHGKYYIYWGPVPALWILAVKTLTGLGSVPDQYPALFFACLRTGFATALLYMYWRRHRSTSLFWPVVVGFLAIAWANPTPYMLRRPAAYEASIFAGQAFLTAGLFFAVETVERRAKAAVLCAWLCGLSWGLVLGCRIVVAPALAPLIAATIVAIDMRREHGGQSRRSLLVAAVIVPVLACAAMVGAFNYLRFDSIFETGARFQYSVPAPGGFFRPRYVFANVVHYLFRPFHASRFFPYLSAAGSPPYPSWFPHPFGYYADEPFVGLAFAVPVFAFAVHAGPLVLKTIRNTLGTVRARRPNADSADLFVIGAVCLAFVAPAPLLGYFAITMRYCADGATGAALLAAVGLGLALDRSNPRGQRRIAWLAFALVAYTTAVALLLWITGPLGEFDRSGVFQRIWFRLFH
jgi:hypothetical protein